MEGRVRKGRSRRMGRRNREGDSSPCAQHEDSLALVRCRTRLKRVAMGVSGHGRRMATARRNGGIRPAIASRTAAPPATEWASGHSVALPTPRLGPANRREYIFGGIAAAPHGACWVVNCGRFCCWQAGRQPTGSGYANHQRPRLDWLAFAGEGRVGYVEQLPRVRSDQSGPHVTSSRREGPGA